MLILAAIANITGQLLKESTNLQTVTNSDQTIYLKLF